MARAQALRSHSALPASRSTRKPTACITSAPGTIRRCSVALCRSIRLGYGGGINLYRYVLNDPLNLVDRRGRAPDFPVLGDANPAFYATVSKDSRVALRAALELCAAACDPGVQASIGDLPGAAAFGVLSKFAAGAEVGRNTLTTAEELTAAAGRAVETVGPGSGPLYGTAVHSAFEAEVRALGYTSLSTEVSYLNGNVVTRGT